ncbi:DUF5957 family protein [Actinoalloteichus hymeniacidonis]
MSSADRQDGRRESREEPRLVRTALAIMIGLFLGFFGGLVSAQVLDLIHRLVEGIPADLQLRRFLPLTFASVGALVAPVLAGIRMRRRTTDPGPRRAHPARCFGNTFRGSTRTPHTRSRGTTWCQFCEKTRSGPS